MDLMGGFRGGRSAWSQNKSVLGKSVLSKRTLGGGNDDEMADIGDMMDNLSSQDSGRNVEIVNNENMLDFSDNNESGSDGVEIIVDDAEPDDEA